MPWYRIEIDQVEEAYVYTGCSSLTPPELARALEGESYIHLTNLVYQDEKDQFKHWQAWDVQGKPEVWINPRRVITFMELARAPKVD